MPGRVRLGARCIARRGKNRAVLYQNGTNRHFACLLRLARGLERQAHIVFIAFHTTPIAYRRRGC